MMFEDVSLLIVEIQNKLALEYPFLESWKISFDSAKKRAGICRISVKEISLSICHIENNDLEVIKDTILHEFAHAIAYELYSEAGHGYYWKKVARYIGAIPRAKGVFKLPLAPWLLVHSCTKTSNIKPISERFRRNKRIKNYFLIGQPETKGELFFVKQTEYNQFKQGLLDRSRLVLIQ
jgi:predicted SprT family Zn-dependent metalloprotease